MMIYQRLPVVIILALIGVGPLLAKIPLGLGKAAAERGAPVIEEAAEHWKVPRPPTSLVATAMSSSQIILAWTDNSSNETGFAIERKLALGGDYAPVGLAKAGDVSFSDTGLTAETSYSYRVQATNKGGSSPFTNEANATTFALKYKRILAYYPSWDNSYKQDKIPYAKLTHICHAFVLPNADGSLSWSVGNPVYLEPSLLVNAHANGVKVLASIGGAGSRQNFVAISGSRALRSTFVNNVYNFCRTYGYDGIDIDWEFTSDATQRENQNLLLQEVRNKFDTSPSPAPAWEISLAVSPTSHFGQWNDYATLNNFVSFYNVMTYNFSGDWAPFSGHNSPLFQGASPSAECWDSALNYMTVARGVPASKINFGVPFFGQSFPNSETIFDPGTAGAIEVKYKNITPLMGAGWTVHYDAGSRVPYLTNDVGTGLVTYDDIASVSDKVDFALTNGGGVFMWELTADYAMGIQPLFNSMRNAYELWISSQ